MGKLILLLLCITSAASFFTYNRPEFDINDIMQKQHYSNEATPQEISNYVDENKAQADKYSTDTMTCTMSARGNSVVYQYTYKKGEELTAGEIDKSLDKFKSIEKSKLKTIQNECPLVKSMIYEYYDSNGDFIVSREYK